MAIKSRVVEVLEADDSLMCTECQEFVSKCEDCGKELEGEIYCDGIFHYCMECGKRYFEGEAK